MSIHSHEITVKSSVSPRCDYGSITAGLWPMQCGSVLVEVIGRGGCSVLLTEEDWVALCEKTSAAIKEHHSKQEAKAK